MALIGVLATLLFFYYGKHYLGYLLIPLLFLIATSSLISDYSVIIMSEMPYLLLTLLALYAYDRSINKPEGKMLFFLAVMLSVLPVHCKSIGFTFSAAYIIVTLFTKRYRYAFAHILLLAGTIIAYRSMTSWDNPYILQLFQRSSYNPEMEYATFGEMMVRAAINIRKYTTFLVGNTLWPLLYSYPVFLKSIVSVLCTVFIVLGWIRILFTPLCMISIYILAYFGILSMWQEQWSSSRFLVGITPFLFLLFFAGIDTLINIRNPVKESFLPRFAKQFRLPDFAHPARKKHLAIWGIILLLISVNICHLSMQTGRNKRLTPDWENFYSCADWLRINTPEDALVMSRKAELLYLRAKRKGISYPFTHDVEKMINVMKNENIQYLVCDNFFWTRTTIRYLYPVIRSYPDMFKIVYAVKSPDTYILEFVNR
jgi:hypothetical protein